MKPAVLLSTLLLAVPLIIAAFYVQSWIWNFFAGSLFKNKFESLHRLTWIPFGCLVLVSVVLVLLSYVLPKTLSEALFALSSLVLPVSASYFVAAEDGGRIGIFQSCVAWLVAFLAVSALGLGVAAVFR